MSFRIQAVAIGGLLLICSGCCNSAAMHATPCGTPAGPRVCKAPWWYWSAGQYWGGLDDFMTEWSARDCAMKTMNCHLNPKCPHKDDFKDGYIAAHVDRSFGSLPQVPAIPPAKYWKGNNRSALGYARAEQWFAGYQAGLNQVNNTGRDSHLTVPTSVGRYPGYCAPTACSNSCQ